MLRTVRSRRSSPRVPAVVFAAAVLLSFPAPARSAAAAVDDGLAAPVDLPPDWTRRAAIRALGGGWRTLRTPHVRVHVDAGLDVDHGELVALETSLSGLFERLGAPPTWRERLRSQPLDYYYTRRSSLLQRFTRVAADGVAFPSLGMAVATHLPHEHELAHLVVHLVSEAAAPSNEPLLQEGLASWLGGDSERAPRVVLALGDRVLERTGLDVGVLWSAHRFQAAPLTTEEKYAVGARFVDFLVATGGIEQVVWLYRLLAASSIEVARRPPAAVRTQVEGAWGMGWEELVEAFRRWRKANPAGGIARIPPETPRPNRLADGHHAAEAARSRLWAEPDGALLVEFSVGAGWVDLELIWGGQGGPVQPLAAPGPGSGRLGLRIEPTGARLRDHRTGRLLGVAWWDEKDARREVVVRIAPELAAAVEWPAEAVLFVLPRFEVGGSERVPDGDEADGESPEDRRH